MNRIAFRFALAGIVIGLFATASLAGDALPAGPPTVIIPWLERSFLVLEIEFVSTDACTKGCDILQKAGAYPVWHEAASRLCTLITKRE